MEVAYTPVPLRCVLMTISMAVLLILLCAGPACTHKNRGHKSQGVSFTILPSLGIPVLTPPQGENSILTLPTQNVPKLKQPSWPPRESWQLFLKNNERTLPSKRKDQEDILRFRRPGPVGPPAPPKHHSYASNPNTQGKRLHKFLQLLRDLLLRKQEEGGQKPVHPILPPKVPAAFICRTNKDTILDPGANQELHLYQWPQEEGSFYRGAGLNLTSGQYTAPLSGLFSFTAKLHIGLEKQTEMEKQGYVHTQLCIQSLCQQNLSLEDIRSITGNKVSHTITLNGILHLQAGQYVSIFLKNKTSSRLVVKKGSGFSGIFLGL
ncbi:erythroferrone [Bombina bombina]|uniref:erythroferrone n=1 Tax=Bombina bombina TaxID=8345 RepID=UPI00235B1BC3|nr:erythroferrone [Bombina bombina]